MIIVSLSNNKTKIDVYATKNDTIFICISQPREVVSEFLVMFKAVILAGGSGKRLWPMSRSNFPKQFKPLIASNTMLQETLNRLSNMDIDSSKIICNEEHRFIVAEQMREINVKPKVGFQAVRVSITGTKISPPLFESIFALGKQAVIARLAESIEKL